jgi:MraZ protein
MFFGRHERQLDDKGRVALPASFRDDLGERCYLSFGENGCIDVLAAEDFETNAIELRERVKRGEAPMSRLRAMTHSATPASVDRQGRIKVDERLREFAQMSLSSKIVVTGNLDRIELWSESVYAGVEARASSELARGDS